MAVKIRLASAGAKKRRCYKIVAANSQSPRDGKFLEKLGVYNPAFPKDSEHRFSLIQNRIKYWLSVGAQPTEKVAKIFQMVGSTEVQSLTQRLMNKTFLKNTKGTDISNQLGNIAHTQENKQAKKVEKL